MKHWKLTLNFVKSWEKYARKSSVSLTRKNKIPLLNVQWFVRHELTTKATNLYPAPNLIQWVFTGQDNLSARLSKEESHGRISLSGNTESNTHLFFRVSVRTYRRHIAQVSSSSRQVWGSQLPNLQTSVRPSEDSIRCLGSPHTCGFQNLRKYQV